MNAFFDRYDWWMKNRFLWGAALVLLVLCYQLALKPTLRLRDEYRALKAGEQVREANLRRLEELRTKAQQTGWPVGEAADAEHDRRPESERIALLAQQRQVTVRNLPVPERVGAATTAPGAAGWHVDYTTYRLAGDFIGLLTLLHAVEQQEDINLLSAAFVKQPNAATREPELILLLRTVRLVTD